MPSPARVVLFVLLLGSVQVAAQDAGQRLDAVDHARRQRRIALTGDLGLPPLEPLTADSPLDSIYFADRVPVPQEPAPAAEGGSGEMFDGFLPAGPSGTGTDKPEIFKYQIPAGYDAQGPAVPMVIGYHGFGSSADSVADSSTIDEVCNINGWLYLAPTGIDDQLYGSPVCQQNVEAVIQWMLENFNVDPDRLYMVGFSMGGGVVLNFAARHRDPDGIMIAALGVVSGTMDWTLEYMMGLPPIKTLLTNAYNFGGTPFEVPFNYQQSSTLYFSADSYPPLPGVLEPDLSMVTNLGSTPTYVTWDMGDTTTGVTTEQPVLLGVLAGLGGTFVSRPVVGTSPTHSWNVLDEAELFQFFADKVANRAPAEFEALIDRDAQVSWAEVTQRTESAFSHVSGIADVSGRLLTATDVQNTELLQLHVDAAGVLGPSVVHVEAESEDPFGCELQINHTSAPPGWLVNSGTGKLVQGTQSDPFAEGLITSVGGSASKSVDLISDTAYVADLSTSPEPAQIAQPLTLSIDAPDDATLCFMVVGFGQKLTTIKSHTLLVELAPPSFIVTLPLGPGGQFQLPLIVPDDSSLHGSQIQMQGIFAAGSAFSSLSNCWVLDIE